MKLFSILLLLGMIACQNTSTNSDTYDGPLKPFLLVWNELANDKYNLNDINKTHTYALGKNDQQAIDESLKDFKTAHQQIIVALEQRYPTGSLKLPIEQADASLGTISNLRITQYQFPWNTATHLSFQLTFDFDKKTDKPLSLVRFEFIDNDGDLFMSSNITVLQSGSYTFEIRPEGALFRLEKALATIK